MFNLVLKDVTIQKGVLITILIDCLTGNLFFINTHIFIYIVVPPIIAYNFIKNSCNYDYTYDSPVLFNSLPVNRKDIVLSKYIDSIIYLIFSLAITLLFTMVFRSIGVSGSEISGFSHINKLMNLEMINRQMNFQNAAGTCIINTVLIISIYFPIYFKVEYTKVKNIFAIASIFFAVIPIVFIKMIGNVNINNFIIYLNKEPEWLISIVIIAVVCLVLYASINLSTKFYSCRDL